MVEEGIISFEFNVPTDVDINMLEKILAKKIGWNNAHIIPELSFGVLGEDETSQIAMVGYVSKDDIEEDILAKDDDENSFYKRLSERGHDTPDNIVYERAVIKLFRRGNGYEGTIIYNAIVDKINEIGRDDYNNLLYL